ncbi:hypothetical protein PV379_23865 [Streptomyces caniscabiei]|nr:hypothetical protein [Streptomyces caniscabiei]MDX2780334.1 hypothetical protein [Streptomyces caniscabiei]
MKMSMSVVGPEIVRAGPKTSAALVAKSSVPEGAAQVLERDGRGDTDRAGVEDESGLALPGVGAAGGVGGDGERLDEAGGLRADPVADQVDLPTDLAVRDQDELREPAERARPGRVARGQRRVGVHPIADLEPGDAPALGRHFGDHLVPELAARGDAVGPPAVVAETSEPHTPAYRFLSISFADTRG